MSSFPVGNFIFWIRFCDVMKNDKPDQQIPASQGSVLFCVQTPKSRLGVVLRRCCILDLCTHNLRRTYFFEHIWMCKHQHQERKTTSCKWTFNLTFTVLGRLWPPHEIGCAAQSGTQSCFFTSLSEDFMEKRMLEYLICFITQFWFFTIRTTDNLELTGMIFGPLNVCVKKQCKDSFFFRHTVYSIPLASLD